MKFLDKLEKRFGALAVPHVVLSLIVAQLIMYAMILMGHVDFESIQLSPKAVMNGEWWRLFSFIISPPWIAGGGLDAIFLVFFWFLFWFMSSSLEEVWGLFRFNVYLLLGIVFSIVGVFIGQLIAPNAPIAVSIIYLELSVFFAFATLFPNHEFLVMMIIPVKVKWLAFLSAGMLVFTIVGALFAGEFWAVITMIGPFLNYILFFRATAIQGAQNRQRRTQFDKTRRATAEEALHTCSECGTTERTDPNRDFRYKMVDGDAICICSECRE